MKRSCLLLLTTLFISFGFSQYPLVAPPQTIDFSGFAGTGFVSAPTAGLLDSDEWEIIGCSDAYTVGGTNTTGDHARGTTAGGVTGGGIYAYSSGGNQAIWVQPTGGDMTPGEIRLLVNNNTGAVIPDLAISYDILTLNNEARAVSLDFAYDIGSGTVNVPVLDYTSPVAADPSPVVVVTNRGTGLIGINLGIGANIELIWQIGDAGGSGSRDEIGIDNIQIGGAVTATVSVGFSLASSSLTEGNSGTSTHTVDVTMPVAPAGSNVVVDATLATSGSATAGTDFTFTSPSTLTFPTTGTYPLTQSVTITVNGDLTLEPNESVDLDLAVTSGTATVGQSTHRFFINNDDAPSGDGIIINEVSQGESSGSGRYEYIELLVIGTPGTTVDLRGWIVDDNSGIFTGGAGSQLGIAEGHVKFTNVCTWEKVPVGSIILIYSIDANSTPPTQVINAAITSGFPGGDDPTDANLDFTYVAGITQLSIGNCASSPANLYVSSDCSLPSNTSYDQYLPPTYTNPDWATITLRNTGDAAQTRAPDASFYHGLSYGTTSGGSCGTCDFVSSNHPEFAAYGVNSLVFDTLTFGPDQRVYRFANTISNDYRDRRNWTTSGTADNTTQTPGAANNADNNTYIQSLRKAFEVVTEDHTYTCDLRGNETRAYLGTNDSLILWIRNNTAFNHGPLNARTIFNPTGPFQNININGSPYFVAKQFRADPTNVNGADDYTIRLYLDISDLNEAAAYINAQTGTSYTGTALIPLLRMYKVPGAVSLPSNSNGAGVTDQVPTTGTYNAAYTFENTWTGSFSAFGLGIPENVLDGDAIVLAGEKDGQHIQLSWEHASEWPRSQTLWRLRGNERSKLQEFNGSTHIAIDQRPLPGSNIYQLSSVLADGRELWSNKVEVSMVQGLLASVPYPQPAFSMIHFPLHLATGATVSVEFYDLTGKLVLSQEVQVNAAGEAKASVSKLSAGLYTYRLNSGRESTVGKIMIGL